MHISFFSAFIHPVSIFWLLSVTLPVILHVVLPLSSSRRPEPYCHHHHQHYVRVSFLFCQPSCHRYPVTRSSRHFLSSTASHPLPSTPSSPSSFRLSLRFFYLLRLFLLPSVFTSSCHSFSLLPPFHFSLPLSLFPSYVSSPSPSRPPRLSVFLPSSLLSPSSRRPLARSSPLPPAGVVRERGGAAGVGVN